MTIGIIQYHLFWFVAHIMVSTHAVAQAYDFTASGAASYDILARNTFYIVNSDSTISTLVAKADSHSANISGKLVVARPTLVKRATFNGCTLSQKSELLIAAEAAHTYASRDWCAFLCSVPHLSDTSLHNLVRRLHTCTTQHRSISLLKYKWQPIPFLQI